MRLWLWAWVWVWLLGLGAIETAPSPQRANTLTRGAESVLFLDRPDFFDYPDSDQARLLAVARFIGEKPVIFVNSGMNQLETASFLAGVWRRAALGPPIGGAAKKGPKEPDKGLALCPECPNLPSFPADE
ncbi:fertilization-influencing membrane protein isoform X1 [Prionailurus viverrinus]|uniref:fertilization-influencing membrane protein isoform X1 n=1 Tax=Panthera leo TaxID=9689 RepID=UPI00090551A5|nr:fertilization-influencing membrane protein isoform X1 [Panthera leo]XP_042778637.1 fertilization-influencing membrane protein isoform X1 [Panthera leo]XP_042828170.1 fertilization-influencing membrane protein isoform X1 [Panthera tigris]XP_042828171.1 fertilization-influencing membrane protein isoform X1 [Panthera tigris]XP_045316558.1 fertilization-influencing membrane protein isoform X1 [Leopardus geoffroyi]XP_047693417.1 fertilization-influencing membrane protein isoform X1 [Prionailurus